MVTHDPPQMIMREKKATAAAAASRGNRDTVMADASDSQPQVVAMRQAISILETQVDRQRRSGKEADNRIHELEASLWNSMIEKDTIAQSLETNLAAAHSVRQEAADEVMRVRAEAAATTSKLDEEVNVALAAWGRRELTISSLKAEVQQLKDERANSRTENEQLRNEIARLTNENNSFKAEAERQVQTQVRVDVVKKRLKAASFEEDDLDLFLEADAHKEVSSSRDRGERNEEEFDEEFEEEEGEKLVREDERCPEDEELPRASFLSYAGDIV